MGVRRLQRLLAGMMSNHGDTFCPQVVSWKAYHTRPPPALSTFLASMFDNHTALRVHLSRRCWSCSARKEFWPFECVYLQLYGLPLTSSGDKGARGGRSFGQIVPARSEFVG